MAQVSIPGSWSGADRYESYVGRWSRPVARQFLDWPAVPPQRRWLDVGCGTGALTETVLACAEPAEVVGIDPSPDFVAHAAARLTDPRASFRQGTAQDLPVEDASVDAVVSGLVLNFVPDAPAAVREMGRVLAPGGAVAAYVWDYARGMQLMQRFWAVAGELDPVVRDLHEGLRFTLCRPDALRGLFGDGGPTDVRVDEIVVPTVFADYGDYWSPFLGGTGPAPAYAVSLAEPARVELREALRCRLPTETDGSIHLTARAWAVRGRAASSHPGS